MVLGFRYLSVSEKPLCLTLWFLRACWSWRGTGLCCLQRCFGAFPSAPGETIADTSLPPSILAYDLNDRKKNTTTTLVWDYSYCNAWVDLSETWITSMRNRAVPYCYFHEHNNILHKIYKYAKCLNAEKSLSFKYRLRGIVLIGVPGRSILSCTSSSARITASARFCHHFYIHVNLADINIFSMNFCLNKPPNKSSGSIQGANASSGQQTHLSALTFTSQKWCREGRSIFIWFSLIDSPGGGA